VLRFFALSHVVIPVAALVYWLGRIPWWAAVIYWAIWFVLSARFTTAYHLFHHRPFFTKRYAFLEDYINWFVAPFYGQSPGTFYVHHIAMHHAESNTPADLTSTMKYQRDNALHFLVYYLRYMLLTVVDLALYHGRKRRFKLVRRLRVGELWFLAMCAVLGWWRLQPTLVIFIVPYLITRTMMICANWAQHAFIDPAAPEDLFRSIAICVDEKNNHLCWNEGYHLYHHVKPTIHYTELSEEFAKNKASYGARDAVVFEKLDFVAVWALLMFRKVNLLARCMVRLPGAPERTQEQVVEMLRQRLTPIEF
jgi:fatty acid desaturase